ncbi:hypothetical protein KIPB_010620 [Kipferlia bialata]|uniref:Uncharacterized protein n=1 Tax=Kipferlia bialata TaxID=797122 RepID=A0A391NSA3_9EUKA|nr:hypothetical protein KIPB_010620 [Kipferlia bialata]|eukprot:g10620.t1
MSAYLTFFCTMSPGLHNIDGGDSDEELSIGMYPEVETTEQQRALLTLAKEVCGLLKPNYRYVKDIKSFMYCPVGSVLWEKTSRDDVIAVISEMFLAEDIAAPPGVDATK